MRTLLRLLAPAALLLALALPVAAEAGTVTYRSDGKVALKGEHLGKGADGVVLIHDLNRTRTDWQHFAQKLANNGMNVLVVDLRGHGESKIEGELGDADYPKMVEDVGAAVDWLASKGAEKITLVGADFGANVAANVAAANDRVGNLVLLSPMLNIKGVKVLSAIESYEGQLLVIGAADSTMGSKTVDFIEQRAKGPKLVKLTETGSGVRLLNRDVDLEGLVVSWVKGTYRLREGEGPAREDVKASGDMSSIETTGTRWGEQK